MMVAHDQPQGNSSKQQLLEFLETIPETIYLAAIVAKGEMVGEVVSEGKRPLPASILKPGQAPMTAKTLAVTMGFNDTIRAVGVWTGPLNNGFVILDVDSNLAGIQVARGASLKGAPFITSTKRNAGKYLFQVPEQYWNVVKGRSLSSAGSGYEILWGQQGIIFGEYPGHEGSGAPFGFYTFSGSLENIPEVPEWLLLEMMAAKHDVVDKGASGFIKTHACDRRSKEEKLQIIEECLKHIPIPGPNSYYEWFRVGNAVKSTLDSEAALNLWREWSKQDSAYEKEWESDDPCEKKWREMKPNGSMSLGTLIYLATHDSEGKKRDDVRFQESIQKMVDTDVAESTHALLMAKIEEALKIDDPSLQIVQLNKIGSENGGRDGSYLAELFSMYEEYKKSRGASSYKEMQENPPVAPGYLIPGLMPNPGVVLLHGSGGVGKSVTAWVIARHVLKGSPFNVLGGKMPVDKGPVLIFNGDQSDSQLFSQLDMHGISGDDPVFIQSNWRMSQIVLFNKLCVQYAPKLIIIDSLTSCSMSVHDENKKEFANPLYRLTRGNGVLFPACTILVLHHSNKQGGFRGTSAIQAAVDEVWGLRMPPQGSTLGPKARVLTVEKSRIVGRDFSQQLVQSCDKNDWHTLEDMFNVQNIAAGISNIQDRVLAHLRKVYPERRTIQELSEHPDVDGGFWAIKKAIQRLKVKNFIEQDGKLPTDNPRVFTALYKAIVSTEEGFLPDTATDGDDDSGKGLRPGDGGLA